MASPPSYRRHVIPEGCSLSTPLGDGIEPLVVLWRETRSDEVGRRLVALSAAFASFYRRKLPKKGPCFNSLAAEAEPAMLDVLLGSITHVRETVAAERLMLVWERYKLDPRIRVYLDRLRANKARRPYPSGFTFDATIDLVNGEWHTAITKASDAPLRPLTDADRALLGRTDDLLASVPKRHAALRLLHDVYAHPADIGRRIVLSDALMDIGDPWGEFIAIQCARDLGGPGAEATDLPPARARERELYKHHSAEWLGRLLPYLHTQSPPRFEAGFPVEVIVTPQARATGLKEWTTIKRIVPSPQVAWSTAYLATMSVFGRASSLQEAHALLLPRESAERDPKPHWRSKSLTRLTLRIGSRTPADRGRSFARLATSRAFDHLRRLDLASYDVSDVDLVVTALERGWRMMRDMKEVGFAQPLISIASRLVRPFAAAQPFRGVAIHSTMDDATMLFDNASRTLRLTLRKPVNLSQIANVLREAKLSRFEVEASTNESWQAANEAAWRSPLQAGNVKLKVVRA